MYALIKNGVIAKYPYWVSDLKYENSNTSFPKEMSDAQLAEFGMIPVSMTAMPAVDHTKNVVETQPKLQDGFWVQTWSVTDASEDEIKGRVNALATSARAERDSKLSASDWTQVDDAPVDKAAWAAYRQALRDIPQQDGFPTAIVWPEKP